MEGLLIVKKLYKSSNRMICGVCAGVAEYLGIDPTVVRIIWAALALSGTGILLYIIAALVMPENMDIREPQRGCPIFWGSLFAAFLCYAAGCAEIARSQLARSGAPVVPFSKNSLRYALCCGYKAVIVTVSPFAAVCSDTLLASMRPSAS